MSSGLSGSCQTAVMLAQDYDGRVHVVNNQRISVTQKQSVFDALELVKEGKSGGEIRDILEADKFNSSIYIMIDTLYYLKKGGRITPAAAALGTLLRLKPVLQIQGEKLDAFAKARTVTQAKSIMINAIKSDIEKRFGGLTPDNQIYLALAHTQNEEAVKVFKDEIQAQFPAGLPSRYSDPGRTYVAERLLPYRTGFAGGDVLQETALEHLSNTLRNERKTQKKETDMFPFFVRAPAETDLKQARQ